MSDPVKLDFTQAVPISGGQSTSSPGVSLNFDQAQHLDQQPANNPYPISDDEKGALHQTVKTGESLLKMPGHIWDAFSAEPKDINEELGADVLSKQYNLPHGLALGLHRLIIAPMVKEHEVSQAYNTIAKANYTPADWEKEPNGVKRGVKWIAGEYSGSDVANDANHKANMHHIASLVPLLGPLAADISEHYLQGDKSGAVASLLSNIVAGKAVDVATKGVARQIGKVAPKAGTVAGEPVTIMAGQEKNAAPIAEEVAKTPSPKIASEQQSAAQQGVKNIATEAANKTLKKFAQSTDEAESFGAASEKVREAAQPTFKRLDELSDGMFSTYQNKLSTATKMIRKATDMESLEKAEAQVSEAQKGIDDLFKQHSDEIGPDDLANAKSAWRDQAVLRKIHSYVESAFSAPEDIANASDSVTRTLRGNSLRPRLNQMVKKIPPADLERVLGKDGVQSLYEVAKLVEKPEGLAEMQSMIGQIASHGYITKIVKSPIEARNLVARYLATSPKVSNMAIHALQFGTAPKVYGPIIGNAIAQGEQPQSDQGNQ